ncbi:exosortase-dependent surface protein XDP1 [Alteromonas genovensis]|uniref:exosortase-dependent surface protein XDP1 n=1 Tax=Alteromonas genovensis TaxID=471225 RepID=UPI002FE3F490
MNSLNSVLIAGILLSSPTLVSATDSHIEEYRYDMIGQGVYRSIDANSSAIQVNGSDIFVSYSTWADTNHSDNDDDDRVIQQNGLDYSGANYGYAMTNKDHGNGLEDWHTIDNNRGDWKFDFDMVLFSFSEEVTLTDTKFKYLTGAGNENQLTVVGFDNADIFKATSSKQTTWTDIASSDAITSVFHTKISSSTNGKGNYSVTYPTTFTEAKYWLVGAYNTFFDPTTSETEISGSGFKLSALKFSVDNTPTTTTDVSEPGALALMSLGLGLVLYRRKRRA